MENKGKTNSVVWLKGAARLLRIGSQRNSIARIATLAISLCCSVHLEAAEPRDKACHVLLASRRCVDLSGKWQGDQGVKFAGLQIKTPTTPSTFPFVLEVATAAGSLTLIEGSFELELDVGLFSKRSLSSVESSCTLVFIPKSPTRLEVVSFGDCEEGHGTSPQGTYDKKFK
jgi:hypothetical protein